MNFFFKEYKISILEVYLKYTEFLQGFKEFKALAISPIDVRSVFLYS